MPLAIHFSWRVAFFTIGSVGFLWIGLWLLVTGRKSAGYAAVNMGLERSRADRVVLMPAFPVVGVGAPVVVIAYGPWALEPIRRLLADGLATPDGGGLLLLGQARAQDRVRGYSGIA